MTQLVVTIEDASLLSELKRAIGMMSGVVDVSEEYVLNSATLSAMQEAMSGTTVKCESFEDYLEKVK